MSRQGKLHSSPFHIESLQYKYAIEHENDGYAIPQRIIQCRYRIKSTNACTLWNSGYKYCLAHKCKVVNDHAHGKPCKECAFFFSDCKHPNKPLREKAKDNSARYCAFFLDTDDRPRFVHVRRHIIQTECTAEIKVLKQKITRHKRLIKQCERELSSSEIRPSDIGYLKDKIRQKEDSIIDATSRIAFLSNQLEKIQGPSMNKGGNNEKALKRK